jgi:hypothetical protein
MLSSTARGRIGPAALLLLPVLLVDLAVWPGHMNADTLNDLDEIRQGVFTDWQSPILEWVWHLVFPTPLGIGPGWVLTLQTVTFMAGVYVLLRAFMRRWTAAVIAVLIALTPLVFGSLMLVGRDMWFLSATLLAFAAGIRGAMTQGRTRLAWFALALMMAWIAQAARQTGLTVLVFLFGFVIWVLIADAPPERRTRLRTTGARIAAVVVGVLALSATIYVSQTAVKAVIGVQATHPEQATFVWDLEAISHHVHRNLFPAQVMPARGMTPIDSQYYPYDVTPVIVNELPGPWPLSGRRLDLLRHAWLKAIENYPVQYAEERIGLELRQVSITSSALIVYHPGIDPNSQGYKLQRPALDRIARGYLDLFTSDGYLHGGIVFSVWIYLLLATASGVVLLRRARGERSVSLIGVLGLSVWGLQIGYLLGIMGVSYRVEEYTVAVGMVTTCIAFTVLYRQRRLRNKESQTDTEAPPARAPVAVG